ncbi:MAG: dephospho-CoA kinase [Bacteroidota bacterium]
MTQLQIPNQLIGITGGIGAGKSLVCEIFKVLGIPVFNADETAKKLVETDAKLKSEIIKLLGNEAYSGEKYNRKFVSQKVFNESILLNQLDQLIHPKVREYAYEWFRIQKPSPYYLYEAALMNAAGIGNVFNKIIVVQSPTFLRIERIKKRDQRPETEILAIINKQKTDEERLKIANFVIYNDEKNSLIEQVLKINNHLSQLQ